MKKMNAPRHHSQWINLLPSQRAALEHVAQQAAYARDKSRVDIHAVLDCVAASKGLFDDALHAIRTHGRIALHFHPERFARDGLSVAEGLLRSGIYKNQFETGLSSGSPTGFAGGERDEWERRLFDGAYHATSVTVAQRPRYGALQVMPYPDGPSPRFGSSYFLLRPEVMQRASFTFGGSQEASALTQTGTLDELEPVLAPLLMQLARGEGAFGNSELTVPMLLTQLAHESAQPMDNLHARVLGRALDSFIEVQVHDSVLLDRDVERLVIDPAFRDHPVGATLEEISMRYAIPLAWHPGYTLAVDQVPQVFRDDPVRPLAQRIAGDGMLNAANIGAVANSLQLEPQQWQDWGAHEDILTQFRRLWHVLVLYGVPSDALK